MTCGGRNPKTCTASPRPAKSINRQPPKNIDGRGPIKLDLGCRPWAHNALAKSEIPKSFAPRCSRFPFCVVAWPPLAGFEASQFEIKRLVRCTSPLRFGFFISTFYIFSKNLILSCRLSLTSLSFTNLYTHFSNKAFWNDFEEQYINFVLS